MEEVGIYRSTCTLPALYKLFSTIIYNRLYHRLNQAQSEDQGGCRRSYQTLDHLATYRLLEQKCREWCIKMWAATVDFMKALDSISQQCLWKVLEKCGIESHHINLLRTLLAEQKGTVSTDKESDMFEMKRGTKQGDPLSSLLFNTVLQKALKDVVRWQKSKCIGTRLGGYESDCSQTGVLLTTYSCSLLYRRSSQNDVCLQTTHREGGSEDPLGKYENCHQSKFEHLKRSGDQQHQSRCIAGERVCQVSRTNNKISATGNNRNQESNSSCLGVVLQVQTGVDIKILPPAAQAPPVQHGDFSDAEHDLWLAYFLALALSRLAVSLPARIVGQPSRHHCPLVGNTQLA